MYKVIKSLENSSDMLEEDMDIHSKGHSGAGSKQASAGAIYR